MKRVVNSLGIGLIMLALSASDTLADELEDPIEILADDGRKIGELLAERHYIPSGADRTCGRSFDHSWIAHLDPGSWLEQPGFANP